MTHDSAIVDLAKAAGATEVSLSPDVKIMAEK
jgi:hypothetical protein